MGRPLKDGLSYFQHDVDMSADEKLEALEAVHGNDGYAVYNKLLERVYKTFGKLDLTDDVQRLSIARKCNVSAQKFDDIIADAVRFHLFDRAPWEEKRVLTSVRIRAQLGTVEDEREKWRKKAEGENPLQPGLSPEKTLVIPGERCIKQSRAEQEQSKKKNLRARGRASLITLILEARLNQTARSLARRNISNLSGRKSKTHRFR